MDWKPRAVIYKEPQKDSILASFRWLGTGFDLLKGTNTLFIQFGRRPVKFFYYAPRTMKMPLFIISAGWEVKFKTPTIRLGTTRRPLDLVKAWRRECKEDSERRSRMTMKTNKISYGTGCPTLGKGG